MNRRCMDADMYVKAFERNCPLVRLLNDERKELKRLFQVAQKDVTDTLAEFKP